MRRSWKTTASGSGAILVAVGQVLTATGEGKDWVSALMGALPAIIAGLGLLAARDNNVTSEEAGAK